MKIAYQHKFFVSTTKRTTWIEIDTSYLCYQNQTRPTSHRLNHESTRRLKLFVRMLFKLLWNSVYRPTQLL
ncbi:hypothetical protein RJT34_16759 [Clitoria ternatea]|uniref:Uncharacterized protein n=1 Tax=Clitoria ternatea TaxID=43366 RepID=A0AAN9PE11_CLITE